MPTWIEAGDVFFTRSSSLLGRLIRWAETDKGEEVTWANHTGVVVKSGFLDAEPRAEVVEALWKTRRGPLELSPGLKVAVYRYTRKLDLERFERVAQGFVGSTYGWWKLFAHLADRLVFGGKKVISQVLHIDSRPICSYLAAKVFAAVGVSFGVRPEAADPDEMLDHCQSSHEWDLVDIKEF